MNPDRKFHIFCLAVVLACAAVFGALTLVVDRKKEMINSNDPVFYYSYVRSVVIDRDLDFTNEYEHFKPKSYFTTNAGRLSNKYSIGFPLLALPFFALTHAVILFLNLFGSGISVDGFGAPYQLSVCIASLFWGYLGIIITYRFCKRFFLDAVSFLAVTGILLASNILYYFMREPFMAHLASFFSVSLFIYSWHTTTYRRSNPADVFVIGLSAALMILVRQQNAAFLAIPVIDGVYRLAKREEGLWFLSLKHFAVFIIAFVPLIFLQMAVWKIIFGSFIKYSYQGESFAYAMSPKVLQVLFSSKHGLISWNPVILLALIGLFLFMRRQPRVGWLLFAGFILQLYINSAWYMWWFGNSFGHRGFIDSTLIFAVGLACLMERLRPRVPLKWQAAALAVFSGWNMVMILAYLSELIPYADYFSWQGFFLRLIDMPGSIVKKISILR